MCQHRGRRLADKPCGNAKNFYCRYHGWKWGIDGSISLVHRREEWDGCPEFGDSDLALPEPRCQRWGGWVWINLDPSAETLQDYLGDVTKMLDPFAFVELHRTWHVVLNSPVNWKVVIEAFNEGYHSGATHSSWLEYFKMRAPCKIHDRHGMYFTGFGANMPRARHPDGSWKKTEATPELIYYQSVELYNCLHALIMEPMMKAVTRMYQETPADAPDEQIYRRLWDLHKEELEATGAKWPTNLTFEHAAAVGTSWHIFPNTIVFPGPDGVLWYRMRPHRSAPINAHSIYGALSRYAPGKEPEIETQVYDGFEAARGINPFLEEDVDNMCQVNEGMKSQSWRGARTNPAEETTIVNFHRHPDRYLANP